MSRDISTYGLFGPPPDFGQIQHFSVLAKRNILRYTLGGNTLVGDPLVEHPLFPEVPEVPDAGISEVPDEGISQNVPFG